MTANASTFARIIGLAVALVVAAILGLAVGNALNSRSNVDDVVRLQPQANVWGNTGPGNHISNVGGLVPENPGGTVVDKGFEHPRGGQRKAADGAPEYADPYRQRVEVREEQGATLTAPIPR